MSVAEREKIPLHLARRLALQMVEKFAPYCERIQIAGSIRRGKPMIKDIELVAIPSTRFGYARNLFETHGPEINELVEYLDHLLAHNKIARFRHETSGRQAAWSNKQRSFAFTTEKRSYKVDLFMCSEETWVNTYLFRTGSAEFNKWLVERPPRGVMPPNMRHENNQLMRDGEPIICTDEAAFFEAMGLPFIPVSQRSDKRWLKFIDKHRSEHAASVTT